MEELLLFNGFVESQCYDSEYKCLVKDNVEILIFKYDTPERFHIVPKITYTFDGHQQTKTFDEVSNIEGLNQILNEYRKEHNGPFKFIENFTPNRL